MVLEVHRGSGKNLSIVSVFFEIKPLDLLKLTQQTNEVLTDDGGLSGGQTDSVQCGENVHDRKSVTRWSP